jgi:hypothetical protein
MKRLNQVIFLLALVVFTGTAAAETKPPEVSHDGLHLQKGTKLRMVYKADGADLSQYTKVALLDAYVAFKKNWKRDHNRDTMDLEQRISDKDMKKIRDKVAKEFNKVFTEVLSTKGGHQMVDKGADGVLIIRPAIINLEVAAPDKMTAGISRSYSASAGQMTLYMELYDGKTGAIIYRVVDPEAAGNDMWEIRNSVTNTAAGDRVMRRWAKLLNDHLAHIKG